MVAPAEALPGRKGEEKKPRGRKGEEKKPRRLSVQEKVIGVLNEMGIDTDPEPHIEKLTQKYMAGTPSQTPDFSPMEEEEARELAELTAWREVRVSVKRTAAGAGVRSSSVNYGISTNRVYQLIDKFCSQDFL
jgi:hypothetical protein